MSKMEDQFLKVAKQAALEAGEIIKKYSGKNLKRNVKFGDVSDFATVADLEAEKTIISLLSKKFPEHNIISEEKGATNKGSEYTWVIDPLDGTFSFGIGMPYYCVSVGLLKENKPVMGIIYHISNNDLYTALEGKGVFLNDKPIQVSLRKDLGESAFAFDFGHKGKRQPKINLYVKPLFPKVGYVFSTGSSATILALVGKGLFDGFSAQGWIWDFAAGTVIVREAGGKVSNFEGGELDWTKERLNIVASNGLIHDQILEALK